MALPLLFNTARINTRCLYRSYNFNLRFIHTNQTLLKKKSLYETKEGKKIRFYFLRRYLDRLKKYEAVLEKKFPRAMSVYRVFMDGMKYFYADFKQYITIFGDLNMRGKKLTDLTRVEIELYYHMPRDMIRVSPVLLLSTLPLTNYVILPLAYYFPRQLLCRHFWNLQQKAEFNVLYLRKRLLHNRPILRHLQLQLKPLKGHKLHKKWSLILGLLGSGLQPSTEQILDCKELFSEEPYNLMYLSGNHIRHLLKLHEVSYGIFKRVRLADAALMLQAMDKAIIKEGGVNSLSTEDIKSSCLMRGLNPTMLKYEDMILWLNQWIIVSQQVDENSLSLLLHCPILLGYNQPSNWMLVYLDKRPIENC